MGNKKGESYPAEFRSKVALEAIRGDLTINKISSKYQVHPTQINRWKQQALGAIKSEFNGKHEATIQSDQKLIGNLYRQIGELTCKNDFLKKRSGNNWG